MRFVALLRGINVGGHRKLPMADLRQHLAAAGSTGVRTYIQSGNAVFDHPVDDPAEVRSQIESAIAAGAGFAVDVVLRTGDELRATIAANPYPEATTEPTTLHVVFLSNAPPDGALAPLEGAHAPEELTLVGRDLYLHLPNGLGRATLPTAVERLRLPVTTTTRNWNTVTKLAAMVEAPTG